MCKSLKNVLARNLLVHCIYEILYNPLNKGSRKELLFNFLVWHMYYKPLNQSLKVNLQNNLKTIVYPDSDSGVKNIFTKNVDYLENEFVRKILNKGDFIVDAGCNVGNRTLVLADIIGGALLIDANQECLIRLRKNFELNNLNMNNYFTVIKAVGREKKAVTFTDLGGTDCQNKIVYGKQSAVKVKSIEMTTIDRELKEIGNPPCSYLKTDLEGHDLDALIGAKDTLRNENLKLVKFERWSEIPLQSFVCLLNDFDFKIFSINEAGVPDFDEDLIALSKNLFAMPKKFANYFILNCNL